MMTDEELDRLVGPNLGYMLRVLERVGEATPKALAAEARLNYRTVLVGIRILEARGLITRRAGTPTAEVRRPAQVLRSTRRAPAA
jgi:DNA-binding MarR family transcriptional regulator